MTDYRKQVEEAVAAITITSDSSFSWLGKVSKEFPPKVTAKLSHEQARSYLTYSIQNRLYKDFYCSGVVRSGPDDQAGSPAGQIDFVESLSDANQGVGSWEDGWVAVKVLPENVTVQRNGLSILLGRARIRWPEGSACKEGEIVHVLFPKEYRGISPGFYMALGNESLSEVASTVRLYFNLTAGLATQFCRQLTELLNNSSAAFKLKIINDDTRFDRCDSGVLYINKDAFRQVISILRRLDPGLLASLGGRTPALTKVLAQGIGLAESPSSNTAPMEIESFGMNRCRLIAEGIVEAYEARYLDLERRLRSVIARFERENVCMDMPYLNAVSQDDYVPIGAASPASSVGSVSERVPAHTGENDQSFLAAAIRIGEFLIDSAYWHDGRCTWIGTKSNIPGAAPAFVRGVLGPDIYSGVAGVALFLAELSRASGDPRFMSFAESAAKQAAATVARVPAVLRIGLYTGWTGIALTLIRVGLLSQNGELIHLGEKLTGSIVKENRADSDSDLLGGRAGTILGLLAISRMRAGSPLSDEVLAFVSLLGKELVSSARCKRSGCSWRSDPPRGGKDLTGLSHGAAGIGYSLLELGRVLDVNDFREYGTRAFLYERSNFDAAMGNWPDFRKTPPEKDGFRTKTFVTYWCHGAPGITLSRMCALSIRTELDWLGEIRIGLQTTRKQVEFELERDIGSYSLCHGILGNAEVILEASRRRLTAETDPLPIQVGLRGISAHSERNTWPNGVGRGVNQSLMLGLAGVGYYYLRLKDPIVPSILTFRDYPTAFSHQQNSLRLAED